MTTKNGTTAPEILIIIVTWNKKQYVLELLASLAKQNYPKLDILVIDNASNDGTVAAIKQTYPQVNLLSNPENLGGTGGFNAGLQWAFEQPEDRYQYLWLLDNDVLVHHRALPELVTLLENNPDIAVAGSTMMQLDYPWQINEMGAFLDHHLGRLMLHRHLERVPAWQGCSVQELLTIETDLSKHLIHCLPYMDVEYVAAASLLVRASVAKKAGLWRDYFIHFDDVEWCLRIRALGHRVVVSAKSLIWHLSAAAKIPTWVLYYDNRNVLDLFKTHGADARSLQRLIRYILKKAVYYHLIGKPDLAQLHYEAIADFQAGNTGKKEIKLAHSYKKNTHIKQVFLNPTIKRVLIAWSVNLYATGIQGTLAQVQLQRPDLQIDCMITPDGMAVYQLPRTGFIRFSTFKLKRWFTYWRLRGSYDLIIQSDYQVVIGLSWLNSRLLFINDEGFCERPSPKFGDVWYALKRWIRGK